MARAFGGYPDTVESVCTGIDRYGLDLRVHTPRGVAYTRVGFPEPLTSAEQLRSVTAELAHAAAGCRPIISATTMAKRTLRPCRP